MSRSKLCRLTVGGPSYSAGGSPALSLLFSQFDPRNRQGFIDLGENLGGFGNLGHPVDLTRQNLRRCSPVGNFKPGLIELQHFLPWIFNAAGVGTATLTYTPGSASAIRFLEYTDAAAVIHRLLYCAVSKATFAATAGREMTLSVEWEGVDWTNPGVATYPNFDNSTRFLFGDLGLTLNGVSTPCRSWSLTIDHRISNDRFFNGFTSAGPLNLDRVVTLRLEVPYGLAAAARAAGAVDGGVPAVLTMSAAMYNTLSLLVFTLPAVRYETPSPEARIPEEQFITVEAQCFGPLVARNLAGVAAPYTGAEITAALTPVF